MVQPGPVERWGVDLILEAPNEDAAMFEVSDRIGRAYAGKVRKQTEALRKARGVNKGNYRSVRTFIAMNDRNDIKSRICEIDGPSFR
jgi:hypothetical protein